MIKPLPRYLELLQYRGISGTKSDINSALKKFAAQDYLDLQVLFNLSWFGFSAKKEDSTLRRLVQKGRFFTFEDSMCVLEKQHNIISRIVELYSDLWKKGAVDITTSPFYHPILPLVCDTSIARECMPECLLPKRPFTHPDDAVHQVKTGIDYIEQKLGKKPKGMWPSEGSVSPAALEVIRDAGITWVATDEGILARSVKNYKRKSDLYHPWDAHGVTVFFRDRDLSDRIGFVYSRNPAQIAVDDFIGRLKEIGEEGGSSQCVSVILDGENPWETFPDSGREFLEKLYSALLTEKKINPVSFCSFLGDNPPNSKIQTIYPGSWINSNYDTWIGDTEEVDGWDALNNARDALLKKENGLSEKDKNEAWLEIFRAEGSDWFWWYGEDHSSVNDLEFDRLFRAHLERVYVIIGIEPPSEVMEPIITKQFARPDVEPTGFVTPVIDGRTTTFYEWLSAGWILTTGLSDVMDSGESIISDIYYGFDLTSFYMRMDFTKREEPTDLRSWMVSVFIENDEKYRLDLKLSEPNIYTLFRQSRDKWVRRLRKYNVAVEKIIELGISYDDINVKTGKRVSFNVVIYENELERERWPLIGNISFVIPDENYQSLMWQL